MATYKYDATTGTYVLVDDSLLLSTDSSLANISVTTDLPDYAPGSTAIFTASNVTVGGTVEFLVAHDNAGADGIIGSADDVFTYDLTGTTQPWTVTDGGAGDLDGVANGVVETSWSVGQDAADQAFVLSATEIATGATATIAFTDKSVPEPSAFLYTATHIELAASSGVETPLTAGAIWANQGSALNTSLTSSGTGQFGTFAEVQDDGAEQGYNTNANDSLDTKNSNNFNHPLQLSDLQAVDANGVAGDPGAGMYYAFRLDLHQSNNRYISLDDLQIWQSTNQTLADFTAGSGDPGAQPTFAFNSGAVQVYDLNSAGNEQNSLPNSVLLNSTFTAGSGGGADLVVLIPTSDFNAANGNYVYFYSAFGYQGGGWQANSTFEEWGALLKAGSEVPPTPHASVSLIKDTVCPEDSQSVATGTLLTGHDVKWTYAVTNTGDVGLSSVVVTDDGGDGIYGNGDPVVSAVTITFNNQLYNVGDLNHNGIIDADDPKTPGNEAETWQFVATGTTVHGTYVNNATVTTDATGFDLANPPADLHPQGFDSSTYTGVTVAADSISVVKEVSVDGGVHWYNANDPTGPILLSGHGDPQYRFTITNNSDVALDIHLDDSKLDFHTVVNIAGNGGSILIDKDGGNPITAAWAEGQNTNTADVSATFKDACDNTATPADSDDANYFGAAPAITIDKNIVCDDHGDILLADSLTDPINLLKDADGKVQYQIVVTNTGNVALDNPIVTDTVLTLGSHTDTGTGNHGDSILDVGETWTYTVFADWAAGLHTNTADVSASYTDSAGHLWTDDPTDSAIYKGLNPDMTLDKLTNGAQNGGSIAAGSTVTWTYTLTNDGNVNLTVNKLTGLTDDAGTPGNGADDFHPVYVSGDVGNDGILSVGEVWTFSASGIAQLGSYTNTAKVLAADVTDDCGDSVPVSATDSSSYTGTFTELGGTLTQGYWGSHTDAWDGISDNQAKNTKISEINPLTSGAQKGGVLLGDLDHDGITDNGECTFFLDNATAKAIESSSTTGDARIIMLQQAIAAQLNIWHNQTTAGDPIVIGGYEPNDVITDAVKWLKAYGGMGNDLVSTEWHMDKKNGITIDQGSKVLTNSDAWTLLVDQTADSGVQAGGTDIYATGEGLKNALMWWNDGHLVTTAAGQVAYDPDGTGPGGVNPATINLNTIDEFWLTLHQQGGLPGIG